MDTFGITQKLGSIGQQIQVEKKNMNNVVNELLGSDESDLENQDIDSSSEEVDVASDLKKKLQNAKQAAMAFQPTQLLHPFPVSSEAKAPAV